MAFVADDHQQRQQQQLEQRVGDPNNANNNAPPATSTDNVILATAGYDHVIKFWDPSTGNCYRDVKFPDSQINCLQITQDRKYLAAAGNPHVRLYEINSKVNTHLTNKIVLHALQNNLIKIFDKNIKIKPEIKFGSNTRFDFLVTKKNYKAFIEVKNVTLSRTNGLAEFPDAVTSRGLKHINELIKASNKGYEIFILYLIQREDCKSFTVANDIDVDYANSLSKAVKKKLNILCYDCKFSSKGIKLNQKIKYKI